MNKREARKLSDKVIDALVEVRKKNNISRYQMEKDLDICKTSLMNIERHKQNPTLYTTIMIARYIRADLSAIFAEIEKDEQA